MISFEINVHFCVDGPIPSLSQRATLNWSRTVNTLRQWSWRALKYTRQKFQERLGHVVPTQDIELEQKIQVCFNNNFKGLNSISKKL